MEQISSKITRNTWKQKNILIELELKTKPKKNKKNLVWKCEPCGHETKDSSNFKRHILSKKHIRRIESEVPVANGKKMTWNDVYNLLLAKFDSLYPTMEQKLDIKKIGNNWLVNPLFSHLRNGATFFELFEWMNKLCKIVNLTFSEEKKSIMFDDKPLLVSWECFFVALVKFCDEVCRSSTQALREYDKKVNPTFSYSEVEKHLNSCYHIDYGPPYNPKLVEKGKDFANLIKLKDIKSIKDDKTFCLFESVFKSMGMFDVMNKLVNQIHVKVADKHLYLTGNDEEDVRAKFHDLTRIIENSTIKTPKNELPNELKIVAICMAFQKSFDMVDLNHKSYQDIIGIALAFGDIAEKVKRHYFGFKKTKKKTDQNILNFIIIHSHF
jgi:hypothetical protein